MKILRILTVVIGTCFFANTVFAQEKEPEEDQDTVLLVVEEMPEFPGGMDGLVNYLRSNITYPEADKKKGKQGTIYVEFVIDKDGSITRVKESPDYKSTGTAEMKKEAKRVISEMPNWKPGKQRGKFVKVRYTIPLKFALKEKSKP